MLVSMKLVNEILEIMFEKKFIYTSAISIQFYVNSFLCIKLESYPSSTFQTTSKCTGWINSRLQIPFVPF